MSESANAASAALFAGTSVLLIRRAFAPWAGYWSLPGGRREPGETAKDCVMREIREELSIRLDAPRPVVVQDLAGFRLAVFAARVPADIVPRPNAEIADWRWLDAGMALPEPHTEGLGDVLDRARAVLA